MLFSINLSYQSVDTLYSLWSSGLAWNNINESETVRLWRLEKALSITHSLNNLYFVRHYLERRWTSKTLRDKTSTLIRHHRFLTMNNYLSFLPLFLLCKYNTKRGVNLYLEVFLSNCVRRRKTLPNLACLLLTLAKALRAFWAIGRAVMTSHSRYAKDSASCDTKFCLLRELWVLASVLADVLLIS